MKIKTFCNAILIFLLMFWINQSWSQSSNAIINDDKKAQKILLKQQKSQAKTAKKSKKEAYKAHLKNQSKAFRKSIKRNYRRQKKIQKEKGRG